MIKVVTANLLAEKPYEKYAGNIARLDFFQRSTKFNFQIKMLLPDIMFLQEVDMPWQNYLKTHIEQLGYSFYFGKSWSSGLAIAWRNYIMKPTNSLPLNNSTAGILSLDFINIKSKNPIRCINLHAPWGEAKKHESYYISIIEKKKSLIIAGDFNTDNPDKNNNYNYFFGNLFNSKNGFKDLTESIKFTARNVKSNNAEKLDYIVGLNITEHGSTIYPNLLSLLLPHCQGGDFVLENENNHFSDHALVLCNISINNSIIQYQTL